MIQQVTSNLRLENARIIYRNFSGKVSKYNQNGFRTFNVLLPTDVAETLLRDGWNVKWLDPQEEGDSKQAHMEVKVQYGRISPKIVTLTAGTRNRTMLTDETVGMLDFAEIAAIDLVIRPYNWEVSGNSGVKAYLKTMYVTLIEDEFEAKYANIDDERSYAKTEFGEA